MLCILLRPGAQAPIGEAPLLRETKIDKTSSKLRVPSDSPKDFTALMCACMLDGEEEASAMASLLLNHQADPNGTDSEGFTAMHWAGAVIFPCCKVSSSMLQVIAHFTQNRPEIRDCRFCIPPTALAATYTHTYKYTSTHTHYTAVKGHPCVLAPTHTHKHAYTHTHNTRGSRAPLYVDDTHVHTHTHTYTHTQHTAVKGHPSVLTLLLSKKALIDAPSLLSGETALLLAARYGRKDAVDVLLAHGAQSNTRTRQVRCECAGSVCSRGCMCKSVNALQACLHEYGFNAECEF